MAMEVEIAIVGGGLGGLALAIGLQERGVLAHVFEKAPKARAHTGTAITLAANGNLLLATTSHQ
jgi:2-polyprenyl-6-methoxyphenol hydroxylase-like FAD-dependent oxidoreductase